MLRKAHNGEGGGDYICLFSCSSNAEETCLSKISTSIQFDHVTSVVFLNRPDAVPCQMLLRNQGIWNLYRIHLGSSRTHRRNGVEVE